MRPPFCVFVLAATLASLTSAAVASDAFRIVATGAGFEAPTRIAAGLRHITFANRDTEIHEAMLIKLPPGMSAQDYVAKVNGGSLFPEGALDYSGPGLTSPGESTEMWAQVDPGEYLLMCWFGDHSRTRSVHAFTAVDTGAPDDEPPAADVVLKLVDYRFELSRPLRKGTQVLRIETPGPSMHEADIYRLLDGRTLQDFKAWSVEQDGVPPVQALGGVLDSHDITRPVWIRRTFTPGRYLLHCEMPMDHDAQGGTTYATHADVGMLLEFEIPE